MRLRQATRRLGRVLGGGVARMARPPARPIRFDRLSLEQGLSQSTVMDVLQDRRGYVWLATEDGLNRYDGVLVQGLPARPHGRRLAPEQLRVGRGGGRDRRPLGGHDQAASRRLERATDRVVRQDELPAQHVRALRFAAKEQRPLDRHREEGLLRLDVASGQWRRLRARRRGRGQPGQRPRLRAAARRQGPAVGGHGRRARPAPGRRQALPALRAERVGREQPERSQGPRAARATTPA